MTWRFLHSLALRLAYANFSTQLQQFLQEWLFCVLETRSLLTWRTMDLEKQVVSTNPES